MSTLRFESTVAAPVDEVWRQVTSVEGIADELWPIAKMTFPRSIESLADVTTPVGQPIARSYILLVGVLPIDRSDVTLVSLDPGRGFVERSPMLSMRHWQHERNLEPVDGGTLITDVLTFEARFRLMDPVAKLFVQLLFNNRHRKLRVR